MPLNEEPLITGLRVEARRDHWTVQSVVRHADCGSVVLVGCGNENRGVTRTLLLPFDRVRPAVAGAPRLRVVSRRRWAHHVARALLERHPFGGLASLPDATIDILPFQLEPALAMLRHGRVRVLIADEVGLGKTIQAGILLRELAGRDSGFRGLVVTPAGVREQWQRELREKFRVETTLADATWLAIRARELPADVNPWALPGIYVASLDLVKRPEVLRALEDVTWDLAVVDEVHNAGGGTARFAAADAVTARARRVLLLTATPPDGDPAQLAAVTDLGRLGGAPITEFRRTRTAAVGSGRKMLLLPVRLTSSEQRLHRLLEHYTSLVWSEAGARQDLRARLAAVVLRKRALSTATSLRLSLRRRLELVASPQPPRGEQLLLPWGDEDPLGDETADDILHAAGLDDVERERACLEQIAAAADDAAAVDSKLTLLLRFLRRVREPVVIFTEYRDTLSQIASALSARAPLLLHGRMHPRERTAVQTAFNRDGGILVATDAASEGLNLHHRCRLVVHFELPWTPMRLEQRTGRVDRLGQARRVHEVLLVAQDTAERLVLAPLLRRARAAAGHGRSLHALDESAVAMALMEGIDVAPPDLARTCSSERLDLSDEALVETERLLLHRRIRARAGAPLRGSGDIAADASAQSCTRVMVLVAVSLVTRTGQILHSELLPLVVPGAVRLTDRSFRGAKRWAEAVVERSKPRVLQYALDHAQPRLAAEGARIRAQMETAAGRERSIVTTLAPVAQRLVQAGLFDRRAVNESKRRQSTAAFWAEGAAARLASDAAHEIQAQATIVALRAWRGLEPRPPR